MHLQGDEGTSARAMPLAAIAPWREPPGAALHAFLGQEGAVPQRLASAGGNLRRGNERQRSSSTGVAAYKALAIAASGTGSLPPCHVNKRQGLTLPLWIRAT